MPLIKPRRLAPGQTIGLVAPSSAPNEPERIRFAAETIESLGFRVRPGAHLHDRDGYLAGTDATRAHDLNTMFADDAVDAIWCVRGGYGASRLLPALDYELMRRKPKALIGYSDITALHMAIQATGP
jgi:muramoyltetrapeptide carboxypeptidase